jgi:hypothetical protein
MSGEFFPCEHEKDSYIRLHPDFYNLLDSSQVEVVKTRMMHHFLRQYAYWIPPFNLQLLLLGLAPPLVSKKFKQQFLDWQILRTDVAFNLPHVSTTASNNEKDNDELLAIEIYERLQDVARALASLNRWEDAAPLCMEIGDAFIDTKGNDTIVPHPLSNMPPIMKSPLKCT